jgi:glycosyltransferase involved in cell wall biosynthesis
MELPLLVTDVGDMGRLVREHGAGLVCAPTVEGLADAVLEFARAPAAGNSEGLRDLLDLRGSVRRFLRDVGAG